MLDSTINTSSSSALLASNVVDLKNWLPFVSTLILAATAFYAPYWLEKWKTTYRSPSLKIRFKLEPPGCHITEWYEQGIKSPVYYFRFLVENVGKTQAEDCEVFLEKIYKENNAGKLIPYKGFTPVNLKWSGLRDPIARTIQPGRKVFCDIGRIHHPSHGYQPVYRDIPKKELGSNKFAFELPERYFSQWDCLIPGKYKIAISIYGKNIQKLTHEFNIYWSGKWQDDEMSMFNEIVIS